jgi:hypothetical protein
LYREAEEQWAPPAHPVFELVPPALKIKLDGLYSQLGSPSVNIETFWEVYGDMLEGWWVEEDLAEEEDGILQELQALNLAPDEGAEQGVPRLPPSVRYGSHGVPFLRHFQEDMEDDRVVSVREGAEVEEAEEDLLAVDFSDEEPMF